VLHPRWGDVRSVRLPTALVAALGIAVEVGLTALWDEEEKGEGGVAMADALCMVCKKEKGPEWRGGSVQWGNGRGWLGGWQVTTERAREGGAGAIGCAPDKGGRRSSGARIEERLHMGRPRERRRWG
jgi:hypothetical protein